MYEAVLQSKKKILNDKQINTSQINLNSSKSDVPKLGLNVQFKDDFYDLFYYLEQKKMIIDKKILITEIEREFQNLKKLSLYKNYEFNKLLSYLSGNRLINVDKPHYILRNEVINTLSNYENEFKKSNLYKVLCYELTNSTKSKVRSYIFF